MTLWLLLLNYRSHIICLISYYPSSVKQTKENPSKIRSMTEHDSKDIQKKLKKELSMIKMCRSLLPFTKFLPSSDFNLPKKGWLSSSSIRMSYVRPLGSVKVMYAASASSALPLRIGTENTFYYSFAITETSLYFVLLMFSWFVM